MMKKTDIFQKHILFDSCVVGELFKGNLNDLIKLLDDNECVLCINDFIKLEFLRIAKNEKEYQKLEEFLEKYFYLLPSKKEIYNGTFKIASVYNHCNVGKSQISAVDCLNAAFLHNFHDNLLLLTLDLNDYPLEIFDRLYVGISDIGKRIIVWAIYKFNIDRYQRKIEIFKK